MSNTFTVNTYSPSDVTLIVGGYQISGWQSISIRRTIKTYATVRGIRGKHTRVNSRDSSASLIVPILMTSQSNEVLSAIHTEDSIQDTGRLTITLKDKSGKSVFSSNEAYITGFPSVVFSGQFEYRAWEIFCQTTDSFSMAGNSRPSTSIFDGALNEATSFVKGLFN